MATNSRGIPTLPSTLIRPSTISTPPDPADAPDPAPESDGPPEPEGQARGGKARSTSRRRSAPDSAPTSKRGVYLTDDVWNRLQLEAIRKKTTVSAIAGSVLDRNLPRLRIERDG